MRKPLRSMVTGRPSRNAYQDWCAVHQLRITFAQYRAIRYLERHGLTFAAQFGYKNAQDIARQHRAAKKAKKRFNPIYWQHLGVTVQP